MTFFNKKEEVIQVQLTPYGKSLLAVGKLKPAFYAFFDDNILYDVEAASGSLGDPELQTQIKTRILQETPYLKGRPCLESPEKLISVSENSQDQKYPHTELNLNYLTAPLGTSDSTSVNAPSWECSFIQGEISGTVETVITGSKRFGTATVETENTSTSTLHAIPGYNIGSQQYLKHIPQINSTIEYTMEVDNVSNIPPARGRRTVPPDPISAIMPDGTFIKLIPDQVLCQLTEESGFLFKDSLEVEAYIYDDVEEDTLIPLKFLPQQRTVVDNKIVDDNSFQQIEVDPSYVEYYIDFITDDNIPQEDICDGISTLKSQNVLVSLDVKCPDDQGVFFDIYGTRVQSIEDCD